MVSEQFLSSLLTSQCESRKISEMLEKMAVEIAEEKEVPAYCNDILVFLLKNWKELASNPHATRICQVIFKEPMYWRQRDYIMDNEIMGHIVQFSQEKYASHIIEIAIKYSSPLYLEKIFNEILFAYVPVRDPEANRGASSLSALEVIMFDQFGNYVFQHLYRAAKDVYNSKRPGQKGWLLVLDNTIQCNLDKLRRLTHGRHILNNNFKNSGIN
ncbi:hypothetical protein M3Y94_00614100 [Aphelenchoides besseyi]|nr:hypothetical protein M3Y94_00614100 [Aphelenchoides besseyi]